VAEGSRGRFRVEVELELELEWELKLGFRGRRQEELTLLWKRLRMFSSCLTETCGDIAGKAK
jgi:hypothetical protein